jgi:long-chain acyl-CoA synthetase
MLPASPFVFDWVDHHAAARPDAPAIGTPTHGWTTFAELQAGVQTVATTLAGAGVGSHGFVVLALPSSAVSVAAGIAIQALGAACIEVSRELGRDGFAEILRQTEAKVAIVTGRDVGVWTDLATTAGLDHLLVVHPSIPGDRMVEALDGVAWTWIPDSLPAISDQLTASTVAPRTDLDPASPALLVYTSGSTGTPRAVVQTHANIDANTRAIARYLELTPGDRAMATLPLFYCYGRSVLQTHLIVGGSVFFDHRFMYPAVVFDELAAQGCTSFAGVPLTFENLRRQVDIASLELPTLRYVTQAGGAMHPDTIRWVRAAFAPAVLFVMYGQTEATSRLAYLPPDRAVDKEGSVGRALDNLEIRIVDDEGQPVVPNAVGNVVARGPSITPGYFRAPEETREILREGWLLTGDLGRLDEDGFLFLAGRTKEFLKLGGNRVSAKEIEEVLARHPTVASVAVVGMTDAHGAEQAVAFVVPASGAVADETELRRHCRSTMPAFKVPKFVRFADDLPLTASNKVAKSELQEWIKNDPTLFVRRVAAGSGGESH